VGGRAILEYRSGAGADVGFATSTGTVVGRATAGFPQPNQLGGFLVLMIPLTIGGAALFPRLRPALAVAALIAAAGVYASFSRAGLLALLTIPLVFLRRRAILLVPVAAVALALLGPELLAERFATLTTSGSELATRQDYWRAAVTLWSDHPLTGIGLGGYPGGYAALPTPGRQFLPTTVLQPPPHAHNVFLNALAEEGVVGLGALVALFGTALVAAWRLAREHDPVRRTVGTTAVATLIAFIVHNIADVTLFETETALFLWVVLGLISGFSQPDRSPPS
jgi:O-antigen ligase